MSETEKDIVAELIKAANDVHNAAKVRFAFICHLGRPDRPILPQVMKNSKNTSRKISKISLEIATSVENTATAARLRGEMIDLQVSVAAALGATKEQVLRSPTCTFD